MISKSPEKILTLLIFAGSADDGTTTGLDVKVRYIARHTLWYSARQQISTTAEIVLLIYMTSVLRKISRTL